ncbi:hypothetical protein [Halorussus caseinilyticus]|uniref:Uncharacterized protein n=1 Tax=Halorussus caseinilyticus TaxID=3034025 RepID=A0ABD5WL49_9EURY|nr:hypothetical protein [Halorussus sp. DT72]
MTADVRSRLVVLLVLAVVGVGLAGVGTTFGVADPITETGPRTEFVVSERNITFSQGDRNRTVIDNTSHATEIKITEVDSGRFLVNKTATPFTSTERRRAKAIVRRNATVDTRLQALDGYRLTVTPVYTLNVSAETIAAGTDRTNTTGTSVYAVEPAETDDRAGTVVVQRTTRYAPDEAVVEVRRRDSSELQYAIRVDLTNETVVDVTDWTAVRRSSVE